MQASHIRVLDQDGDNGWIQCCSKRKFKVPIVFCKYVNATSNGRDPINV